MIHNLDPLVCSNFRCPYCNKEIPKNENGYPPTWTGRDEVFCSEKCARDSLCQK